ncbi:ABC transporter permease [Bacillaceae bacterium SIJ1]|uniref:ABC transporter permease n=1 Tax=Litoribacterium kuwaitense TaxID=1398745 RepID=UPI0013ED7BB2|nr:ABC transporter permease [Litoribacterium kuwaitense]NGP44487.1 ABC transporter permease [Litoribacterium kuwaitense]
MGLIYGIMALGVYLSFRVLDFPDLTVDGSFVTGGAVAALMITNGIHPLLATIAALAAGFLAGCITGLLNTKGKINALLSGILMMIALYSINLRIMGQPNLPLLNDETLLSQFEGVLGGNEWSTMIFMVVLVLLVKVIVDLFLKTEVGLALRSTGDNARMSRSFSANTNTLTVLGLGLSNGLVALSGAFFAQYSKFSDVSMGIGMIVIGLASVIIGEALFGKKTIMRVTLSVILGAIIYRIVVALALRVGFLDTGDMKLITAVIVIIALIVPRQVDVYREKARRKRKRQALQMNGKGGNGIAPAKSDL